jgi:hypothetical protein
MYEIRRPTELVDWFAYAILYAPEFPVEDGSTNASAFAVAFKAFELFTKHCKTDEGKERVRECERNLQVAFELYEGGDSVSGEKFVSETRQMFQRCRKYIDISDE